jgi:hypothetical protein
MGSRQSSLLLDSKATIRVATEIGIIKASMVAIFSSDTNVEFNRDFAPTTNRREDLTMGDKGGKKDKDKSKKQKSAKQEQKVKGTPEKNRPKG